MAEHFTSEGTTTTTTNNILFIRIQLKYRL